MKNILQAVRLIFYERRARIIFFLVWLFLFFVMFYLPIASTPGNDASFQAKLFTFQDYTVLALFSFLSSLVITMQVQIFLITKESHHIGEASVGAVSGFVATLFATSTCTLCLGALISFLGAGTVFTLVEHRVWLVLGSLALLYISLHLSSRRLIDGCDSCRVKI